ncbi:unnamed protein product [Miscanthus lutarioriparius]|uniref:Sulfotransferase n=1 Tax=Miscanthus lutarioriparius TaxID=422564 RepID=A0A811NTR2_9POAL|nr:unnamed protein product [Miscanthus lutarioriparius]
MEVPQIARPIEAISFESHAARLISKLPAKRGGQSHWCSTRTTGFRPYFVQSRLRIENGFKPRPEDVILATNPKCGTTWLKALAFTVINRFRFLEQWTLLEPLSRVLEESIEKPDNVLFLKYEDMTLEPTKYVIRLATFLGAPFSIKEIEDGIPEEVVRLCSFEKPSSLSTNQTGEFARLGNIVIEKSSYFRKGKVGDWVNHMREEMGRKLNCIVEEKLKGSGLVL